MPDFNMEMRSLAEDMRELQKVTCTMGWDREDTDAMVSNPQDLGAKPVTPDMWHSAMKTALKLAVTNPWLARPTPGADPGGFVWLTWTRDTKRFELAIKADRFEFILNDDAGRRVFERPFSFLIQSSIDIALREVSEALRSLLPHVPETVH